jgi:hypothetical protein
MSQGSIKSAETEMGSKWAAFIAPMEKASTDIFKKTTRITDGARRKGSYREET